MEQDPGDILKQAREAFNANDYPTALKHYLWFFNHSVEINPAYHGVRLSYCLSEWATLGNSYPPAQHALTQALKDALLAFKADSSHTSFHEYAAIADYLNKREEVFEEFKIVHKNDKNLAKTLFTSVYEYCAEQHLWSLCREYLGRGEKQLNHVFEMLNHMTAFAEKNQNETGKSIYKDALNTVYKECVWVLTMLKHANAVNEYNTMLNRIQSTLAQQKLESLYDDIVESMSSEPQQKT